MQLNAAETRRVSLTLERRAFAYYNIKNHDWTADAVDFNAYVGGYSARIALTGKNNVANSVKVFVNSELVS